MATDPTTTTSRDERWRGPATWFALAFGAIYLLVGLAGFAVTGFDEWFASETDEFLLGFELNPLHNVVHLLIGAALLSGGLRDERAARAITWTVGAAYALVGIVGLVAMDTEIDILALNTADNWLHIGTAAIAFIAAAMSQREAPRHDTVAPNTRNAPDARGR